MTYVRQIKFSFLILLSSSLCFAFSNSTAPSCPLLKQLIPVPYAPINQEEVWRLEKQEDQPKAKKLSEILENKLKTLGIQTRSKVGTGITGAEKVSLSDGTEAIMKSPIPRYGVSAEAEVAAYKLDQFLGDVVHVPITVKRSLDQKVVTLQSFIKDTQHAGQVTNSSYRHSLRFFDFLIDNTDRRPPNLLKTQSGEYVAIDHGLSFRSDFAGKNPNIVSIKKDNAWSLLLTEHCGRLLRAGFSDSCVQAIVIQSLPPESLYVRVKNTPVSEFQDLFKDLLTQNELDAFLKRRDTFVQVVEDQLKKGKRYPKR